jgi:hypothetical protein
MTPPERFARDDAGAHKILAASILCDSFAARAREELPLTAASVVRHQRRVSGVDTRSLGIFIGGSSLRDTGRSSAVHRGEAV